MYVIMDVEWYEGRGFSFITQISGLRVDENYKIISRHDLLVAPRAGISAAQINWNHVSFSGNTKNHFLRAPSLFTALESFNKWLQDDDILIWWHSNAEQVFFDNRDSLNLPRMKSRVIHKYLQKIIPHEKRRGTPADLCRKNYLPIALPEHRSFNDVNNLLTLIKWFHFPLALLDNENWHEPLCANLSINFSATKKPNQKPYQPIIETFVLDHSTKLIHRKKCAQRGPKYSRISIPAAIEKKYIPCECCYSEFEQYVFSHVPAKKGVGLVYSSKSHHMIVHHADCPIVSRINPDHIKHLPSGKAAIASGFRFCERCSSILPYYQPISHYVTHYCQEQHMKCYLKSNALHIISLFDRWQIIVDADTGLLTLFHRNRGKHKVPLPETLIPDYHLQTSAPHTIPDILKYIVNHDKYKGSKPTIKLPSRSAKENSGKSQKKQKDSRKVRAQWKGRTEKNRIASLEDDLDEFDLSLSGAL